VSSAPRVVLVGAPASGKTRIAKKLGSLLGLSVVDSDRIISRDHGPIPDIFLSMGEEGFRRLERTAVREALMSSGIVALGGGAVIDPETREELKSHTVALITISEEAVAHRLGGSKRPLLQDGVESWKALVTEREPWYQEVSNRSFDTSHQSIEKIAHDIVDWLEEELA